LRFTKDFLQNEQVYLLDSNGLESHPVLFQPVYGIRVRDGISVNQELVKNGFAMTDRKLDSVNRARFLTAENEACRERKGLWSKDWKK